MEDYKSCKKAIESCLNTRTFAIAHLFNEEKVMEMHIHDCCEIYYSISGGKQFLIDNRFYPINAGDIFIINQYESHYLTQVDQMVHERIVLSVHPEFVKQLSTPLTDLTYCFAHRTEQFRHKLSLDKEQQSRFLYYINKIKSAQGFGHDVLERAVFTELLLMLNELCLNEGENEALSGVVYNNQVDDILLFINQNISSLITIGQLARHFYMSESYLSRIFKSVTGTTINKYITARRISIAKSLLSNGVGVNEACERSGFGDYSNFLRAFTKAVGVSPKKYARHSLG